MTTIGTLCYIIKHGKILLIKKKKGLIEFYVEGMPEVDWIVDIFVANDYDGIEKETEEAAPRWFSLDRIPYDEMWPDDRVWMPLMLEGKSFRGKVYFDKGSRSIINHHVEVVG